MSLQLVHRKGRDVWYVRGRVGGVDYEESTGTTAKREAEAYLARLLLDIHESGGAGKSESPTLRTGIDRLREAGWRLSRSEERYVTTLMDYLMPKRFNQVSEEDIHLAAHRLYPKAKPQTKNRQVIRVARRILRLGYKKGWCDFPLIDPLDETGYEPQRPITLPSDVTTLLAAAEGELEAILNIFVYQGWRVSETLKITRDSVDFETCEIHRWVDKAQKTKPTALDPAICDMLRALPEKADGRFFKWRDRGAFYKAVDKLTKRLGLPKYRPHRSRRGFATELVKQGANLKSIMRAGGWASLQSVMPYAEADVQEQARTISMLRRA